MNRLSIILRQTISTHSLTLAALITLFVVGTFPGSDDSVHRPSPSSTVAFAASQPPAAPIAVDIRLAPAYPHADAENYLLSLGATILESIDYFDRISVTVDSAALPAITSQSWVVDFQYRPNPETQNDGSRTSIGVDLIQPPPYGLPNLHNLDGGGVRIGEFDDGHPGTPITAGVVNTPIHDDLLGRWIPEELSIPYNTVHSTHVAGTAAGDGVRSPLYGGTTVQWAGMAPKAWLHTWWMAGAEGKMLSSMLLQAPSGVAIDLSTNSWIYLFVSQLANCPQLCINQTNGAYILQCGDVDKLIRDKKLSIFCAAGNAQQDCPNGWYSAAPPSTAKNVICVGAVDKLDNMAGFSSWGPTLDGRLKPDVVAVGVSVKSTGIANDYVYSSGTSMACPAAAGTGALLIQKYRQLNSGANPDPALLKAIMLNTATDLGNPGPDFKFGYGKVNAPKCVDVIQNIDYVYEPVGVNTNGVMTYNLSVPAGCLDTLKVMLVWSDMEFTQSVCNDTTLINDLDLTLIDPTSTTHLPLTADANNPNNLALPLVNRLDPVEQVLVSSPMAGTWTIQVKGFNVPNGPQPFALVWCKPINCAQQCVTAPDSMVNWWPLDEYFGPNSYDIEGGPYDHGTWIGSPAVIGGKVAAGLQVGAGSYVEVADSADINFGYNGNFSMDAWFRFYNGTSGLFRPIVDKRDLNTISGYLFYVDGFNYLNFTLGNQTITSSSPLITGFGQFPWYHVAATVDRVAGMKLYVNGGLVASNTTNTTGLSASTPGLKMKLGGINNSILVSQIDSYWDLDEIEIFDNVLSAADVQSIYNADYAGKCKCRADTLVINTGWNHQANTLYPVFVPDAHWSVLCDPDTGTTEPRPATTILPHFLWQPALPNSWWISSYPTYADNLNGTYCFDFKFCLDPGFASPALSMDLRADDSANVFLNGNFIGATPQQSHFSALPTSLFTNNASFFLPGTNHIQVYVDNVFQVAMGLNVSGFVTADGISLEKEACCDPAAMITGTKWNDLNGNGVRDSLEPPLQGWGIMCNGAVTQTDNHGNYYFRDLAPGSYSVAEVAQPGWNQTYPPAAYFVNLNVNQVAYGLNFGNHQGCPIAVNGDVNTSGAVTSADIIVLVNFCFKGGPPPQPCVANGDVNCSGTVTSADIIRLVNYVFKSGPAPCDICTSSPMACP